MISPPQGVTINGEQRVNSILVFGDEHNVVIRLSAPCHLPAPPP
jgi:hypothetical protein